MQQMLGYHLALLLHQLGCDRVDKVEHNGKDGEGAVYAQGQPPDELLVLPVPKVLEHQEPNRESGQSSR